MPCQPIEQSIRNYEWCWPCATPLDWFLERNQQDIRPLIAWLSLRNVWSIYTRCVVSWIVYVWCHPTADGRLPFRLFVLVCKNSLRIAAPSRRVIVTAENPDAIASKFHRMWELFATISQWVDGSMTFSHPDLAIWHGRPCESGSHTSLLKLWITQDHPSKPMHSSFWF
jgi:hypothetical protein